MTDKSAPPGQKKEDFGKLAGFGGDTMPQGTCDILYRIYPYIYTFIIPKSIEVQQMYACLIKVARNRGEREFPFPVIPGNTCLKFPVPSLPVAF